MTQRLYMRDTEREETVRLDSVAPGGSGGGKADPLFQGASADGAVAFFTDTRRLTVDANASGSDLYRCEIVVGGGELACELTNLTAGVLGNAESAEVQGLASGISEDGSSIYFVAKGVLDLPPTEGRQRRHRRAEPLLLARG